MTWREVLDSNIDCCTDETWEDWFEKYPDSVYDYCYQFYILSLIDMDRLNKMVSHSDKPGSMLVYCC